MLDKERRDVLDESNCITILDGPLGTQLAKRGVATPPPLWSAAAITSAPEAIVAIHRDYADAGATIHTAATFRTKRRDVERRRELGLSWQDLTRLAIELARKAVPAQHRIAGSLSPLADCYRPDLSPIASLPPSLVAEEHREMAECLADGGCDFILCETFPHTGEAIVALEAALTTGLPVWLALTAGPDADLMTPDQMADTAIVAEQCGADAVLVNCTPASETDRFVQALASAKLSIPLGVYANAGTADEGIGWETTGQAAAERYWKFAKRWLDAGAVLLGGCCGTGPEHIHMLRSRAALPPG
ncbi:hypothetical protein CGZ80_04065 [Rhodopirellula sp. MGV]|nr:hypothetical protein CGZ80_04065 [Rhodopirellula sp. MGV]PNY37111.1 homocysteine S-methyltransferase family protein [Rhodopirellula baltica]